jgi:hypothetical protein
VTFAWWCAAGALTVISAALCRRMVAILSAANPAVRLPWTGLPANTPRGAKRLGTFAVLCFSLGFGCVDAAMRWRHPYDVLWGLPLGLIPPLTSVVLRAKHNRRVRNAA